MLIKNKFLKYFDSNPLLLCIWTAFLFRMLAVIFSRGIAFGYDHNIYIENAQELSLGISNIFDFIDDNPSFFQKGYSILYLGFNYYILEFLNFIGIYDPNSKILIVRLLHGLLSLLTVFYCFRITYIVSNQKNATIVGLLIALLWFMPFVSVRNLSENLSQIFILASIYRILRSGQKNTKFSDDIFSGFIMSVGFSFSYNVLFFIFPLLICMLLRFDYHRMIYFFVGALISFIAFEGIFDVIVFKTPFYRTSVFLDYIFTSRRGSGLSQYYMYVSILSLVFSFPIGIFMFLGFFKTYKKYFLIFVPTCFYILLHCFLGFKQERLMANIIPMYVMLAVLGFDMIYHSSKFLKKHTYIYKVCFGYFLIVNFILLFVSSIAYIRKSQVEAMVYLSKYKNDTHSILVDDSNNYNTKSFPDFYFGRPLIKYYLFKSDYQIDSSIVDSYINISENNYQLYSKDFFTNKSEDEKPKFVLFVEEKNLQKRLNEYQEYFPEMSLQIVIEPSLADKTIEFFNKGNLAQKIFIYKTTID